MITLTHYDLLAIFAVIVYWLWMVRHIKKH